MGTKSPSAGIGRRCSTQINVRQAFGACDAEGFAAQIGLPLRGHVTIHWGTTDVGDDPDGRLFARVREGFSKALMRRNIPFVGVWVRERGKGGRTDAEHCHMLFHLPLSDCGPNRVAEFTQIVERLVERHAGSVSEHTVLIKVYELGEVDYLLKGADGKTIRTLGLRRRPEAQGLITAKRCGWTENIGVAARARLNRAETRALDDSGDRKPSDGTPTDLAASAHPAPPSGANIPVGDQPLAA
jgi:hypothetical protein